MPSGTNLIPSSCVAPYAGAWIEIPRLFEPQEQLLSRPTRARGLKFIGGNVYVVEDRSRPTRARGLKCFKVDGLLRGD